MVLRRILAETAALERTSVTAAAVAAAVQVDRTALARLAGPSIILPVRGAAAVALTVVALAELALVGLLGPEQVVIIDLVPVVEQAAPLAAVSAATVEVAAARPVQALALQRAPQTPYGPMTAAARIMARQQGRAAVAVAVAAWHPLAAKVQAVRAACTAAARAAPVKMPCRINQAAMAFWF